MASDTVYQATWKMPSLIEQGKDQSITLSIEKDGSAVTLTSGTLSLFKPGGSAVVDAVSGTVSTGTFTSATIASAPTDAETLGDQWLVKVDLVISGSTFTFYNDAALVAARLYPPISQTDLVYRHSEVVNMLKSGVSSLQNYIELAWFDIVNQLYSSGCEFWKWRTSSALRPVMFSRCFQLIFRDYATLLDPDDRFSELADFYAGEFEREGEQMRSRVDTGEDDTISADNKPASAVIMLSSGARSRRGRGGR